MPLWTASNQPKSYHGMCTWMRLRQGWEIAVRWRDGRHRIAAAQGMLQEAVVGQVQVSAQVDRMLCAQRGARLGFLAGCPAPLQGLPHAGEQTGGMLARLPFPADPGQVTLLPCR